MMYYIKSRDSGGVWRVPTDGGKEEEVKVIIDAGFQNQMFDIQNDNPDHWHLTEKGIHFLVCTQDKSGEVRFYDFETEMVSVVVASDKIPKNIQHFFATDGTNFLFNVKENVSNIMLADLP